MFQLDSHEKGAWNKIFCSNTWLGVWPQGSKSEAKKGSETRKESKCKMVHCQADDRFAENQMVAQSCGPSPGTMQGTVVCPSWRWKSEQFICWLLPLTSVSLVKVCSISTILRLCYPALQDVSGRGWGVAELQRAQCVHAQTWSVGTRGCLLVCGGSSDGLGFMIMETTWVVTRVILTSKAGGEELVRAERI